MALIGLNFDKTLVTPEMDAMIYDTLLGGRSCVIDGFNRIESNVTGFEVAWGLAVIQGYFIQGSVVNAAGSPSSAGSTTIVPIAPHVNSTKYLCLTVDLNETNTAAGTIGASNYKVTYKQVRLEFLTEAQMKAQIAEPSMSSSKNSFHTYFGTPARVLSIPLYKVVIGASTITSAERIEAFFQSATVGGSLTGGMVARCQSFTNVLPSAANNIIPFIGSANNGATASAIKEWHNEYYLKQDSRAQYAQLLTVQHDGIYRIDINGALRNGNYDAPKTPTWKTTGKAFQIVLQRSGDQFDQFGNANRPPSGSTSQIEMFHGYTTGIGDQYITGTMTITLFKGDSISLHFLTAAPTATNNPSAILASKTGISQTQLLNFSYGIEYIQGLNDISLTSVGGTF